jgi:error-prone DNA polymerase
LTLYRKAIERLQPVPASHMHRFIGRRITMIGWLITEKPVETKQGLAMEFITLEDHTALYDATLFPEVYRRCSHLLSTNRAYMVQGLVEEAFGVMTLTVLDLRWLDLASDESGESPNPQSWYDDPCDALPDPPARLSRSSESSRATKKTWPAIRSSVRPEEYWTRLWLRPAS